MKPPLIPFKFYTLCILLFCFYKKEWFAEYLILGKYVLYLVPDNWFLGDFNEIYWNPHYKYSDVNTLQLYLRKCNHMYVICILYSITF